MSNIIKSFRVIDSNKDVYEEVELEDRQNVLDSYKDKYLEIVNKAKIDGEKILKEAKLKSKELKEKTNQEVEEVMNKAKIDSESIKKQSEELGYISGEKKGWQEGYQKGKDKGLEESQKIIQEALDLKELNNKTREDIAKALEPYIISMILNICDKVMAKDLTREDFVLNLVEEGISKLDPTDNLTIIVSKNDYDVVLRNKEKILSGASFINNLNIKYDINFKDGDCIFEMDKGNIDLSVQDQMEEVKKLVYKILNNE